jgi:dolichol-phosphate mannosyltransferase
MSIMNFLLAPLRLAVDVFKESLFVRYVFSGGTAATIDIVFLFVLTEFFGVYYLSASIVAMTISFIARFLLQKFVTFRDEDRAHATKQFFSYSLLYVGSLLLTTLFLYVFVEYFNIRYIPAQIITIGLTACISFYVYKFFVFKKSLK